MNSITDSSPTATASASKVEVSGTTDGEPESTQAAEISYPEGGLQAWLTVAGGVMIVFCAFGAVQSFGVYQDYYTRFSLNEHPPSDISWIGSVQTFFLFAGGLPSGKLFDGGRFRELIAGGSLIYLFSSFMLSLAAPHHYYQNFLSQGVGMGLGMGIMFLPALSVSAQYFKRKRGLVMGIILSGSSLGSVLYPIMINHLFINPSIGFAWGVRIVSFLDLALLLVANFIMKTRLPPRSADPNAKPIDFKGIIRDVPFLVCLGGITLTFWGLFVPIFYIQLFSVKHGVSGVLETYSVAILNAAGFFGRIVPMFLSDMYGPFNVIIITTFIAGCLVFALLGATSTGGVIVFAILFGFFSGGFVSLSTPTSGSFSRDLGEVGTRIGMMTTAASIGLLTGNPISGALLQPPHYIWVRPVIFSGVTVLSGASLMFVARTMQAKRRNTQRL